MKQIKTVMCNVGREIQFDEEVNKLLSEGWTLRKREILKASGELSEAFNAPHVLVLYAEMEKEVPPFPEEITI